MQKVAIASAAMLDRPDQLVTADPQIAQAMFGREKEAPQRRLPLALGASMPDPFAKSAEYPRSWRTGDGVDSDINEGHLISPASRLANKREAMANWAEF
jgi:hypothetical protein